MANKSCITHHQATNAGTTVFQKSSTTTWFAERRTNVELLYTEVGTTVFRTTTRRLGVLKNIHVKKQSMSKLPMTHDSSTVFAQQSGGLRLIRDRDTQGCTCSSTSSNYCIRTSTWRALDRLPSRAGVVDKSRLIYRCLSITHRRRDPRPTDVASPHASTRPPGHLE